MKKKISISIDGTTLELIQAGIELGQFRNTSHALEYAIKRLLEEQNAK